MMGLSTPVPPGFEVLRDAFTGNVTVIHVPTGKSAEADVFKGPNAIAEAVAKLLEEIKPASPTMIETASYFWLGYEAEQYHGAA